MPRLSVMLGDTGTEQDVADGWPPRFSAIWRLNREVCCSMRGQHGTSTHQYKGLRIPIKFTHIHALSDSLIKRHTPRSPTSYLLAHSTALLDLRSEPKKQLRPFFVCRCRMSKIIERV